MRRSVFVLTFVFLSVLSNGTGRDVSNGFKYIYDPDMDRNVTTLISSKGYPVEDHIIQTSDGFLLSVQRIPHGKQGDNFQDVPRKAVYLQHGLLSSASDWVINFPEQSLGFILADLGYDVWMGNTRGNTYSRHHVKYSDHQREFWNFSFDEMGAYDLPAIIDYVLNATRQEKLYYVGHSQGTSSMFALLSESPEYNKKVEVFIALAPVTTVGYMTSAIKYLAPFTKEIDFLFEILGVNEFLPDSFIIKYLSELACDSDIRILCEDVIFLLFGTDKYELNQTRLGVYAAQLMAGTSTKSIIHYAQMVNSKLFTKYDYGSKMNKKMYNQTTPPEYDLTRITTPVALIWSMNDKLADPVDVDILRGKLKSLVSSYLVPFPLFNHGDYVLAVDAHRLVYDQVIHILSQN